MSRCHACGLKNSECDVCLRMALALAVGAKSRIYIGWRWLELNMKGLEENGAGPSGSRGGERSIFNDRGQGQACWDISAWRSVGD